MAALNLSWLPDDATDRETFAEESWPTELRDFAWPPVETDPFADAPPPSRPPKAERISWITELLQRWCDRFSDEDVLYLRHERGFQLMKTSWNGVEPLIENPAET